MSPSTRLMAESVCRDLLDCTHHGDRIVGARVNGGRHPEAGWWVTTGDGWVRLDVAALSVRELVSA